MDKIKDVIKKPKYIRPEKKKETDAAWLVEQDKIHSDQKKKDEEFIKVFNRGKSSGGWWPSEQQILMYRMGKSFGMKDHYLRTFMRYDDGTIIDSALYDKIFSRSSLSDIAKSELYVKCLTVYVTLLDDEDPHVRMAAAAKCMGLGCGDVPAGKEKFDLDESLSYAQQIKSVNKAVIEDMLGSFKAAEVIKGLQTLMQNELDRAKLDLSRSQSGSGSITWTVDATTDGMLQHAEDVIELDTVIMPDIVVKE